MSLSIDAKTLIINMVGSPAFEKLDIDVIPITMVESCANWLSNNVGGYLFIDTQKNSLEGVCSSLKCLSFEDNGIHVNKSIGLEETRNNVNKIYSSEEADRIEGLVDKFFEDGKYKANIGRLIPFHD
jgi:hypothetical protein